MPIKPLSIYTQYHSSERFSLSIKRHERETKIIMNLKGPVINTRELPLTYGILMSQLPSILHSICYNDENIPFNKEVLQTELGHLFEHILIEYLCLVKLTDGSDNVEFSGVTKWNWRIHPKGSFHITISAGMDDTAIMADAMGKSIALINQLLATSTKSEVTLPSYTKIDSAQTHLTQIVS